MSLKTHIVYVTKRLLPNVTFFWLSNLTNHFEVKLSHSLIIGGASAEMYMLTMQTSGSGSCHLWLNIYTVMNFETMIDK